MEKLIVENSSPRKSWKGWPSSKETREVTLKARWSTQAMVTSKSRNFEIIFLYLKIYINKLLLTDLKCI